MIALQNTYCYSLAIQYLNVKLTSWKLSPYPGLSVIRIVLSSETFRSGPNDTRYILCTKGISNWVPMLNAWWCHRMETFSALLAICAGNSLVNSPHKGKWRGALMFSLICPWMNDWVNNREAGDLRRHRTHYDVTVMEWNHARLFAVPLIALDIGNGACDL